MKTTKYQIYDKEYEFSIEGSSAFKYGKNELLSNKKKDIVFNQDWYKPGYKSIPFLSNDEFVELRNGLTKCIQTIIQNELGIELHDFDLSKYHHVVKTTEDHYKVVSKTRDLFPEDFNFPINTIFPKFEKNLGFNLSDIDPHSGGKMHIIVRINRPHSSDFNPPHKDIYEEVDKNNYIPQFVNFWIPICGVTEKSSLPVAESSHLIKENKILRTVDGGVIAGNNYRVRMIKEWGGSTALTRPQVNYGEYLIFSSHLVHGLAINEEDDNTRVALEFRLFKVV